jgi:hypothetical protein
MKKIFTLYDMIFLNFLKDIQIKASLVRFLNGKYSFSSFATVVL